MEEMAEAKTLRAIVAGVARLSGAAPAHVATHEPAVVEHAPVPRTQLIRESAPRCIGTVMEVPLE